MTLKIPRESQSIHRKRRALTSIAIATIQKEVHIAELIHLIEADIQTATRNEMPRGRKNKAAGNTLTTSQTVIPTVLHTKATLTNLHPIAPRRSLHLQSIKVTRRAVEVEIRLEKEGRPRMKISGCV
jgi:hypothetical protein